MLPRAEMKAWEGHYAEMGSACEGWRVLDEDEGEVQVWAKDTGKLLCHVARGVISPDICDLAVRCYRTVGASYPSTNRGTAAGLAHRKQHAHYERGQSAQSGVVGFLDSTRHDRPCRLTAFSRQHFAAYRDGLPFVKAINACFRDRVPTAYARQRAEAERTAFHIEDTAFSTVTVNLNFRTSVHRDRGDFTEGFGTLVVCSDGIKGGHLLFPRYRLAILLRTGDFLAMDVHEWHGNTAILAEHPDAYRLSFVCYLRQRMARCTRTEKQQELLARTGIAPDAASICAQLFRCAGLTPPPRQVLGMGAQGLEWWEMAHPELRVQYKYKRYTVHDRRARKVIHNLLPALEYIVATYGAPPRDD